MPSEHVLRDILKEYLENSGKKRCGKLESPSWNCRFNLAKIKKQRWNVNMAKDKNVALDMNGLVALIATLDETALNELGIALKANDVKITARKTKVETPIIGYQLHTKDWGAKNPRKAGDKRDITERNLDNLLRTWVRGKDKADKEVVLKNNFMAGLPVVFGNFTLYPNNLSVNATDENGVAGTYNGESA